MAEQAAFEQRTKNGYPLDEVVSSLQKCIRRGMEEMALFCALELGEGYDDYLWRRLMVIASEDIGLADNFAPVLVQSLWQSAQVQNAKEKNKLKDKHQIGHAVMYLCRTQKTRVIDMALYYVSQRRDRGWRPAMPDVGVDMHTKRGREMGRGDLYFCEEGAKVIPEAQVGGPDYLRLECTVCRSIGVCPLGQVRQAELKK